MMPTSEMPVSDQVLNSWKEIAHYLDRGLRTVQRWESELALPVRRPRGKSRSAVFAMRWEIDEWLNTCPLVARDAIAFEPKAHWNAPDLLLRSDLLCNNLDRSRQELSGALDRLMGTIRAMAHPEPLGRAQEHKISSKVVAKARVSSSLPRIG